MNSIINYNISNYKWQRQPYISWKGKSTNSAVPVNSKPNSNYTRPSSAGAPINNMYNNEANDYSSPFGKARPLKQYRKQLKPPRKDNGVSSIKDQSQIDTPGGSVYLGVNSTDCVNCQDVNVNNFVGSSKENINQYDSAKIISQIHKDDKFYDDCKNKEVCISCNPENNIIKSAVTLIDKKYYSDTKNYLKSRVKRYEQNLNIHKRKNIEYITRDGTIIYPSNNSNGTQTFGANECIQKGCNTNDCDGATEKIVIYKPSNQQFSQQGAVSSSLRTLNLKYNNITNNGSSFYSAWGKEGANAGKYSSDGGAPYFLKSKYEKCKPRTSTRQPKGGAGKHTICFHTNSSDFELQRRTKINSTRGTGTGFIITKQMTFN